MSDTPLTDAMLKSNAMNLTCLKSNTMNLTCNRYYSCFSLCYKLERENAALKARAEKMTLSAYTKSEELRAMTERAEKAANLIEQQAVRIEALKEEIDLMQKEIDELYDAQTEETKS